MRGDSGAPCTGQGQSNCDYGTHYCSSNVCTPLWEPTCPNYTNFPNKDRLGTTGPILYGFRLVSVTADPVTCGSATLDRWDIALSAYSSTPFPSLRSQLSGLFRVQVNGSLWDGLSPAPPGNNYTVSGENRERAEIVVSSCHQSTLTSLSGGYYFTNGNFFCFQANR